MKREFTEKWESPTQYKKLPSSKWYFWQFFPNIFPHLQACRKKLVKWKNYICFCLMLHCHDLTSFFSNHMQISNNSKIRQKYHCVYLWVGNIKAFFICFPILHWILKHGDTLVLFSINHMQLYGLTGDVHYIKPVFFTGKNCIDFEVQ